MSNTLDPYLPSMSEEEKQKVIAGNFSNLNQKQGMSGANLLASIITTTQQTIAVATYTKLTSFSKGFTTSGGFLSIEGQVSFHSDTQAYTYVSLRLDGKEVHAVPNTPGTGFDLCTTIKYVAKISPGNHTVELFFRTSAGTTTINAQTSGATYPVYSALYIVEFL